MKIKHPKHGDETRDHKSRVKQSASGQHSQSTKEEPSEQLEVIGSRSRKYASGSLAQAPLEAVRNARDQARWVPPVLHWDGVRRRQQQQQQTPSPSDTCFVFTRIATVSIRVMMRCGLPDTAVFLCSEAHIASFTRSAYLPYMREMHGRGRSRLGPDHCCSRCSFAYPTFAFSMGREIADRASPNIE